MRPFVFPLITYVLAAINCHFPTILYLKKIECGHTFIKKIPCT